MASLAGCIAGFAIGWIANRVFLLSASPVEVSSDPALGSCEPIQSANAESEAEYRPEIAFEGAPAIGGRLRYLLLLMLQVAKRFVRA